MDRGQNSPNGRIASQRKTVAEALISAELHLAQWVENRVRIEDANGSQSIEQITTTSSILKKEEQEKVPTKLRFSNCFLPTLIKKKTLTPHSAGQLTVCAEVKFRIGGVANKFSFGLGGHHILDKLLATVNVIKNDIDIIRLQSLVDAAQLPRHSLGERKEETKMSELGVARAGGHRQGNSR